MNFSGTWAPKYRCFLEAEAVFLLICSGSEVGKKKKKVNIIVILTAEFAITKFHDPKIYIFQVPPYFLLFCFKIC